MQEKIFVTLDYLEESPVYELIAISQKTANHGTIMPCAVLLNVKTGEFTYDNVTSLIKVTYTPETNFIRRHKEEE